MTAQLSARIRAWFADTFYGQTPGDAADAMADVTRWAWLPALSGVAVGADYAYARHMEPAAEDQLEHTGTRGKEE